MNGYEQAKAKANQLNAEKIAKEEAAKAAVQVTEMKINNSLTVNQFDSLGLQNIDAEDIKPPTMLLVQGISDKSELTDTKGVECPNGKFFLKGMNEIVGEAEVCFVLIRKDHFHKDEYGTDEERRWEGSRMYRAIAIRLSDLQPFSIDFKKSSLGALSDLLTVVTAQKKPVYLYKTLLRAVPATNKKGIAYFKSVVNLKGMLTDDEKLVAVKNMYQQFNMRADEILVDEEVSANGPLPWEDTNQPKDDDNPL